MPDNRKVRRHRHFNASTMQKLKELYTAWHGTEPVKMEKLPGAGSNREYYRMTDENGKTYIGCVGTSKDEN